jgi:hypothetical protein
MPTVTSENKAEFDRKFMGSKGDDESYSQELHEKLAKELSPEGHAAYHVLKAVAGKGIHKDVKRKALQNLPKDAIDEAQSYIDKETK